MIDRFISQLDTLVPFLALGHKDIFTKIHDENQEWFTEQQRKTLPETYSAYTNQVSVSAFLLGYSYFEAFIADLAKKILIARPKLLPKNKNITFGDVVNAESYETLLEKMVEQHVFSIMYDSIEKISDYYAEKLHIAWPLNNEVHSVVKASLIRNCYMHNGGIVDIRLHEKFGFELGSEIILNPSEVHGYGITIRHIAYEIFEQAKKKHLK